MQKEMLIISKALVNNFVEESSHVSLGEAVALYSTQRKSKEVSIIQIIVVSISKIQK